MPEIEKKHHVDAAWDRVMHPIRSRLAQQQVHPSHTVLLLPHAPLISEARKAWLRGQSGEPGATHFVPRFETPISWAHRLGGCEAGGDDVRRDATWCLAPVAAAVPPMARAKWGAALSAKLTANMASPMLALEAASARMALDGVASARYPTDPIHGATPDLLVVLDGFQADPLTEALKQRLGDRVLTLSLFQTDNDHLRDPGQINLHAALEAEDEAQRAAACVLVHLAAGRSPVALVAQDPWLTQRVCAMLGQRDVTWHDETGECVNQLLEPSSSVQAQVVILPLSQLLGRPFMAVVLPGCDEVHLPVSPEPPGRWIPAQRALLGLPSRAQLIDATRTAWQYALQFPRIDVLWRQSDGGEKIMSSGLVQALQLQNIGVMAADPRVLRAITPRPVKMPAPQGDALPVPRLSSAAYQDLRCCPYRFFALHQLKLQAPDALDTKAGPSDFSHWLQRVLNHFHEALNTPLPHESIDLLAMLNSAKEQATQALGLSPSEVLPFAAAWPRVRAGYLAWLAGHEQAGVRLGESAVWQETPLGRVTLVGQIDRIDYLADGSALVLAYKTEPPGITTRRIKAPCEDTQLAFHAALLSDDTLAAAYVNVGEKGGSKTYAQDDIVALRDVLLEGIAHDMGLIAQGAAMPALGAGSACDGCAARGLCRKDFWGIV